MGHEQTIPLNLVIKHGYPPQSFSNEEWFDSDKHIEIQKDFLFFPEICEQDWYYNGESFQETPPE